MQSLYQDAKKEPLTHLLICTLLSIGIITLPIDFFVRLITDNQSVSYILNGVVKLLLSLFAVYFIFRYGFKGIFGISVKPLSVITLIIALIVAVNNFPFYSLLTGELTVDFTLKALSFALYCLGVACIEELFFRGLVFPMSVILFENKSRPLILGVLLSSAIFGATHLVNLFGGNIGGVFLQVGYSFLIGALCAITLVKTKNIIFSIIVHAVYNFCGMLPTVYGVGTIWSIGQIILTATVGVVATIYFVVVIFKEKYEKK